jgi:hypothetical protein
LPGPVRDPVFFGRYLSTGRVAANEILNSGVVDLLQLPTWALKINPRLPHSYELAFRADWESGQS